MYIAFIIFKHYFEKNLTGVKAGCIKRHPVLKLTIFHKHFKSVFSPGSHVIFFHKPRMQRFSIPAKLEYKL